MSSWHSYCKLYNLGHAALRDLFEGDVVVEEKVDGSQFSFGVFNGELRCRSKGVELIIDNPEKLFSVAVETAKALAPLLVDGWTYRGEYLRVPKHNTLAYDRTPAQHIIIFDINTAEATYLSPADKKQECLRLGLECVQLLRLGPAPTHEQLQQYLEFTSVLGGQKLEGVVIKNYAQFGPDKKALMGKHVSEAFKEIHQGEWKTANPKQGDVVQMLVSSLKTPARWNKAVQHLKERGELTDSPKDIGNLMKEVQNDTKVECEEMIKQHLFDNVWPSISRSITGGLPQWYKEELLAKQFNVEES